MNDLSGYDSLRENAQKYYGGIGRIRSPAFNQEIFFSAEGFNHIIYKGSRSERERPSQILRFKLLPLAVKLIGLSTTYQEYEESLKEFDAKRFKKRVRLTQPVKYWGLIAIIDGRKIKVILRKIADGKMYFWSVVPAWVTNHFRDARFFTTMKGDPEKD